MEWHNDNAIRTVLPSYFALAGTNEPHEVVVRLIFVAPSDGPFAPEPAVWTYTWLHDPQLDLRPALLKLEGVLKQLIDAASQQNSPAGPRKPLPPRAPPSLQGP